jgi:hypothetical protein
VGERGVGQNSKIGIVEVGERFRAGLLMEGELRKNC